MHRVVSINKVYYCTWYVNRNMVLLQVTQKEKRKSGNETILVPSPRQHSFQLTFFWLSILLKIISFLFFNFKSMILKLLRSKTLNQYENFNSRTNLQTITRRYTEIQPHETGRWEVTLGRSDTSSSETSMVVFSSNDVVFKKTLMHDKVWKLLSSPSSVSKSGVYV